MKFLRYLLIMVLSLIGILIFVNVPNLAKAMLETVSAVSWQDWLKYVLGIVIGTISTYLAMRDRKKVIISEDNSEEM